MMFKKIALSVACMAPLVLAPVAIAAPAARPGVAQQPVKHLAAAKRPSRSKERIYTYKPRPPKTHAAPARPADRSAEFASRGNQVPFVGFSPTGNSVVGVGLWRVPKVERDPNRSRPLRDPAVRTTRTAAVGVRVGF